jgi:probable rRNA maturation factor
MSASISVDVQVASEVESAPGDDEIQSWVTSVVDRFPDAAVTEVSVRIVDEGESRELNERFRGKDGATNVLSFPADNGDSPELPAGVPRSLGDIVICGPVVEREAGEQQKAAADHWAHMLVHGTLHLLGYDHEVSEEAEAMESMERQSLAARGVADPYAT